jgi:biotin carboxyl carrier protein
MKKLRITIGNTSYDVTVEDLTEDPLYAGPGPATRSPAQASASREAAPQPAAAPRPQLSADAGAVTSPMAGVIKSVLVHVGQEVKRGEPLVILEAMKMEYQITAPAAGVVKSVGVKEGDSVQESHVLVVLE